MASKRRRSSTDHPPVPSGIGMLALAFSMLGLASCLIVSALSVFIAPAVGIVVAFLPILGLTGVGLGVVSLMRKRAPNAREYDRGPALGAIIVGLATAVLQGAFGVGILRTYLAMPGQVVPVVNAMIDDVEASNPSRARLALAEPARPIVTDARIEAFVNEIRSVCGDDLTVSFTVGTIGRARAVLREAIVQARAEVDAIDLFPKPLEITGSKGRLVAWILLDDNALNRDQVKLVDMMLILPGRECLILLPEGRFAQFVRPIEFEIVDLPLRDPLPEPPGSDSGPEP